MAQVALPPGMRRSLLARWLNMARGGQVLSSFLAVVAAYWLYSLLFVPLIEPNVDNEVATRATDDEIRAARQAAGALSQELARYFPPGSWELDSPAIFERDQTLFLFKSPEPEGNQLKLKLCTLISLPKRAAPGEPQMQPIIMRASEGATLRFEHPVNLGRLDADTNPLTGGQLDGDIVIRRIASRPDGSDALLITTRDIKLEGNRAFTPQPVKFQMGASHGSGRDLVIHLSGDPKAAAKSTRAGGLKTLELLRDVVMYLDLGAATPPAQPTKPTKPSTAAAQIKITCRGAFQYDFARYTASFHDKVDVVRHNHGPSDVLNCEVLSVLFAHDTDKETPAPSNPASPTQARNSPMQDTQVRAIEARGDPVVLRSPSRGIDVRCQALHFEPAPGGATGRVVAAGPGSMQGNLPRGGVGKYLVEWTREFRFEPDGAHELASLHGGASVRFGAMGKITANNRTDPQGKIVEEGQLFAWLTAPPRPPAGQPPATPNDQWQVERVLAQGDVVIDSPQLAGATGKLEAWIERPKTAAVAQAVEADPTKPQQKSQPNQKPSATSRFAVRSGAIQIKLLADGEQLTVADASLENQARLEQISLLKPGEKPLVAQGDRLHVLGANTPQTRVTVAGKPGLLEAGGITLRGDAIEMEKQTSRLWVDGAGRMTMPMEQDLNGKPLAKPEPVDIVWRGRMNFQNTVIVFERGVEVKTQAQLLVTERLSATLNRAIDFSNAGTAQPARGKPADQPQLALVQTFGPTFLQSRQFDERGGQTSFDVTHVYDLSIDRTTGAVNARGPGSLTHVGFNTAQNAPGAPLRPGAAQAVAAAKTEPELVYLNVQFERALVGNLNQHVVTFSEPTKTVYGPINDWQEKLNPEEPSKLGPNAIVLDSRELTVRETPSRNPREPGTYELMAKGNVTAEGSQFVARGQLATYSQQKDQLVLKGEGPSPAEISVDSPEAGRRNVQSSAIIYSVRLQHVRLIGAQSVGVDVLQNKPAGAPKKKLPF